MARGSRAPASMRSIIGIEKAAVLPVPVLERTTRSRPASAGSMAAACTPVATLKPFSSMPWSTSGEMGKSEKARSVM